MNRAFNAFSGTCNDKESLTTIVKLIHAHVPLDSEKKDLLCWLKTNTVNCNKTIFDDKYKKNTSDKSILEGECQNAYINKPITTTPPPSDFHDSFYIQEGEKYQKIQDVQNLTYTTLIDFSNLKDESTRDDNGVNRQKLSKYPQGVPVNTAVYSDGIKGVFVNFVDRKYYFNRFFKIDTYHKIYRNSPSFYVFLKKNNEDIDDENFTIFSIDNMKVIDSEHFSYTPPTGKEEEALEVKPNIVKISIADVTAESMLSTSYFKTYFEKEALNRTVPGGKKASKLQKKEILGKVRCIYKIPGSKKDHVKHKGKLITVTDYKKLVKPKTNKRP
jgi:hypothetical protein